MRARDAHKYFIESLIIDLHTNNPVLWSVEDWNKVTKGHAVIGYLFTTKQNKVGSYNKVLNLYLINRKFYRKSEVELPLLRLAFYAFENKCTLYPEPKQYAKRMVFMNPPIEEWLATKDNWIAKLANELTESWQITYDEALSSIYFIVTEFYHRGDVYMGNLSYIYKGVVNKLRMKARHDKNRLYGDNVISGDSPRYIDKDGNVETWFDTIGQDDPQHAERDFLEFKEALKQYMLKDFSVREIDQIFRCEKISYLPQNLYKRLFNWRKKHPMKEVLAKL